MSCQGYIKTNEIPLNGVSKGGEHPLWSRAGFKPRSRFLLDYWIFQTRQRFVELVTRAMPSLFGEASPEDVIAQRYWGYSAPKDGGTVEYRVEHPQRRIWQAARARGLPLGYPHQAGRIDRGDLIDLALAQTAFMERASLRVRPISYFLGDHTGSPLQIKKNRR